MHRNRSAILIILALGILSLVSGTVLGKAGRDQGGKPEGTPQSGPERAVEETVLEELRAREGTILAAVLFDTRVQNIRISANGQWAIGELAPFDPQAQIVLPVEPGLAILHRQSGKWKTAFPQDRQWKAWLQMLPEDVMSVEAVGGWLEVYDSTEILRSEAPLGGYKLPWPFGQTRYVSQSTAHDRWRYDGMDHFAWDFYALGGGSVAMWEVLAARPGKVYMVKDSEPNGCDENSGCKGNYLVLKDESTYPVTYQLYLHLAQNSIPDDLQVGVMVNQGQFLGIADDTGFSTGHHLHFMVHTASYSYWGTAVDITFDDVDINGGRPRAPIDQGYCNRPEDVCYSFRTDYVSGNKPDPEPPTGDISNITNGQLISNNAVTVTGWGADVSSGFRTAQLIAAPRNSGWQVVGSPAAGSPFSIPVDFCQSGLPVGPTGLGLRLMDNSGFVVDLTGLRWVTLDFTCSPPVPPAACVPGPSQAALFDEVNFQGTCKLLGPGGFVDGSSLSPLGGGHASSLLLGSGARATLYNKINFEGRAETFNSSDSNLADNRIQNNSVNSLFVRSISDQPFPPQPGWPPAGSVITDTNSLNLYWLSSEGNMQYQVELTSPSGILTTSSWLNQPWLNLADGQSLKEYGLYTWRVRSRMVGASPLITEASLYPNKVFLPVVQFAGVETLNASSWSSLAWFTYTKGVYRPSPVVSEADFNAFYSAPSIESLNSSWTRTGLWSWDNTIIPWTDGIYFWYGEKDAYNDFNYSRAHSGSLTTPPIKLSSAKPLLRFWYYYDTEVKSGDITRGSTKYWDQRLVQVSVDGSPYVNLYQLEGEAGNEWQESPFIPIPATSGQTIRLRFYFDTVDGIADGLAPDNYYQGWFVDNVSITASGPGACTDGGEPNNSPARATLLVAPHQAVSTVKICPEDEDYYAFTGLSGEKLVIDIDARTLQPASALDSVVELIDGDGKSVLAYNDDEGSGKFDSYLVYQLPRSGLYFVRVHNYYLYEGGGNFTYNLKFNLDGVKPQVGWINPGNGYWINKTNLNLAVQAMDDQTGIEKVEYFMHDSNWNNLAWISLGQANGTNGVYTLSVNPSTAFGSQVNMALFALVTDKAGNTAVTSLWNMRTDFEIPSASLQSLASAQSTNMFRLSWSGADAVSGIDHFEIQRQVDGGSWVDVLADTQLTEHWEVVEPDHTYAYRMRSVDKAGNASSYQTTTTGVPDSATLCANAPDAGEIDNTFDSAAQLILGNVQDKSFCNPSDTSAPDQDWISIDVQEGNKYWLVAYPQPGSPAAPGLALFADDHSPIAPVQMFTPSQPGSSASLFWISDRTGQVRLRIENADPSLIGARYFLLGFLETGRIYLPVIGR